MNRASVVTEIQARTTYKIRAFTTGRRGFRIYWSNGYGRWFRDPVLFGPGQRLILQPNEVFVEGMAQEIDWLLPTLPILPIVREG